MSRINSGVHVPQLGGRDGNFPLLLSFLPMVHVLIRGGCNRVTGRETMFSLFFSSLSGFAECGIGTVGVH